MVYVGNERQKLYETLRNLEGEITFKNLYEKLGWTYDELYYVCKSITTEFKQKQRELLGNLELSEIFNPDVDKLFLQNHFTNSLIDIALLLEYKLPEIRNPKREKNAIWLGYRKMWLRYRGY